MAAAPSFVAPAVACLVCVRASRSTTGDERSNRDPAGSPNPLPRPGSDTGTHTIRNTRPSGAADSGARPRAVT